MNKYEHILVKVIEECNEVSQRCTKAMRFGLAQVQQAANDKPEQNPGRLDNLERIRQEYYDLVVALDKLGITAQAMTANDWRVRNQRISKYLDLARAEGTLQEEAFNEYGS